MVQENGMLEDSYLSSLVVDRDGYPYFINPVSDGIPRLTAELLNHIVDRLTQICDFDCDIIMAPEAMGIPLATAVCMRTGVPFSVIRKRRYGLPGEISLDKSTGYSVSTMYINGVGEGDRVILLDDVVSTGGTMKSIVAAIEKTGAQVVGIVTVFNKNRNLPELEDELGIPIKHLIDIGVKDGKPVIFE